MPMGPVVRRRSSMQRIQKFTYPTPAEPRQERSPGKTRGSNSFLWHNIPGSENDEFT